MSALTCPFPGALLVRLRALWIMLLLSAVALYAPLSAADYPHWRGPAWAGSGADSGAKLVSDLSQAKKLWTCEQRFPDGQGWTLRGNYSQSRKVSCPAAKREPWSENVVHSG